MPRRNGAGERRTAERSSLRDAPACRGVRECVPLPVQRRERGSRPEARGIHAARRTAEVSSREPGPTRRRRMIRDSGPAAHGPWEASPAIAGLSGGQVRRRPCFARGERLLRGGREGTADTAGTAGSVNCEHSDREGGARGAHDELDAGDVELGEDVLHRGVLSGVVREPELPVCIHRVKPLFLHTPQLPSARVRVARRSRIDRPERGNCSRNQVRVARVGEGWMWHGMGPPTQPTGRCECTR